MPFEWKLIIYRKWLNVRVNVCSCDWTTSLVSASDLSCATLGEKEASEGRREERSSRKRGVRCFFATKKGCNSSSLLLSIIWISFSHWILISQSPNWQDLLLSNQQPKTTEFIIAKKKKEQILTFHWFVVVTARAKCIALANFVLFVDRLSTIQFHER